MELPAWSQPPSEPRLGPGEAHVWRLSLAGPCDAGSLSPEEQARARAFAFERDRARYQAAHAGLRRVLASYLGVPAARVVLGRGPGGKPELDRAAHPGGPAFSLAHSGDWALVAVGAAPLGVDLEAERELEDLGDLSAAACTPGERAALAGLGPAPRQRAFFVLWARKEALLKATGQGLRREPSTLDASPLAPALGRAWEGHWLYDLPPTPSMAAALCTSAPLSRLACYASEEHRAVVAEAPGEV